MQCRCYKAGAFKTLFHFRLRLISTMSCFLRAVSLDKVVNIIQDVTCFAFHHSVTSLNKLKQPPRPVKCETRLMVICLFSFEFSLIHGNYSDLQLVLSVGDLKRKSLQKRYAMLTETHCNVCITT